MTITNNFVNFLTLFISLTFSTVYGRLISYDKSDDFYNNISTRPHFVLFHTSWCAHCLRVKPVFETLAERYDDSEQVILAKVDCDSVNSLCSDFDIIGYPTLRFFWNSHEQSVTFKGKKSLINFVVFIEKMLKINNSFSIKPDIKHSPPNEEVKSGPFELTSTNFHDAIISSRFNFIKFFVPWCSHCQAMSAVWRHLRDDYVDSKKINIAKIDCTKHHNICDDQGVTGYPSLILFKNGESISQYYGERDYDLLKNFIGGHLYNPEETSSMKVPTTEVEVDDFAGNEFELTAQNFRSEIEKKIHLVLYCVKMHPPCSNIREDWIEFRKTFVRSKALTVSQVDCSKQNAICSEENIISFPSILIYYRGKKVFEYNLEHGLSSLRSFVRSLDVDHEKSSLVEFICSHLILPRGDRMMLHSGVHLILFYRPRWDHIGLLSSWIQLTQKWLNERKEVTIAAVNCDFDPTFCHDYEVHSFPTILYLEGGKKVEEYTGEKNGRLLNEYIDKLLNDRRGNMELETERDEL